MVAGVLAQWLGVYAALERTSAHPWWFPIIHSSSSRLLDALRSPVGTRHAHSAHKYMPAKYSYTRKNIML